MPNCGRQSRLKRNRRRRIAAAELLEVDAVCASCGVPVASSAGPWQQRRKEEGGPLHCPACWGDYESELPACTPAAVARWWHTPGIEAWLDAASLSESSHLVAGETFVAVSDPESTVFPGVGSTRPWPAAKRLVLYLEKNHGRLIPARGAVVVEVGAGACPLPGMWLGRHAEDARIVLTDLPALLPLTELNLKRNNLECRRRCGGSGDTGSAARVELASLRWGCGSDLACGEVPRGADLVLAADVAYLPEDIPKLMATLAGLGGKRMLVAFMSRDGVTHRYDELVAHAASAHGWQCVCRAEESGDALLKGCVLFEFQLWSQTGGEFQLRGQTGAGQELSESQACRGRACQLEGVGEAEAPRSTAPSDAPVAPPPPPCSPSSQPCRHVCSDGAGVLLPRGSCAAAWKDAARLAMWVTDLWTDRTARQLLGDRCSRALRLCRPASPSKPSSTSSSPPSSQLVVQAWSVSLSTVCLVVAAASASCVAMRARSK